MKPAGTRQRRNRPSTAATLSADPAIAVPALPEPGEDEDGEATSWHPMTRAWWADIWQSPMAPEYDESDVHGLFMLAAVVNDFWSTRSAKARREAASEIRLQSQRFGLSPIDRRRLQWEIDRGDDAASRTRKRRDRVDNGDRPAPNPAVDPRAVLRAVK